MGGDGAGLGEGEGGDGGAAGGGRHLGDHGERSRRSSGTWMFSLVNYARFLHIDAENALRKNEPEIHPPVHPDGGGGAGAGPVPGGYDPSGNGWVLG